MVLPGWEGCCTRLNHDAHAGVHAAGVDFQAKADYQRANTELIGVLTDMSRGFPGAFFRENLSGPSKEGAKGGRVSLGSR